LLKKQKHNIQIIPLFLKKIDFEKLPPYNEKV